MSLFTVFDSMVVMNLQLCLQMMYKLAADVKLKTSGTRKDGSMHLILVGPTSE